MAPGSWNGHNYGGLHTGTVESISKAVFIQQMVIDMKKFQIINFQICKKVRYVGKHKDQA